MTDIKDLATYLFSVAKLSSNEPDAVAKIEARLTEHRNASFDLAIAIVESVAGEWGDVARCTKHTCVDITSKLREQLKS
jgi:hypothetical protein